MIAITPARIAAAIVLIISCGFGLRVFIGGLLHDRKLRHMRERTDKAHNIEQTERLIRKHQ